MKLNTCTYTTPACSIKISIHHKAYLKLNINTSNMNLDMTTTH